MPAPRDFTTNPNFLNGRIHMSRQGIFNHIKQMTDAIVCLRKNGHNLAAVMLTYTAIDHMAWLSIPGKMSYREDFEAWVDKFMLPYSGLACTASELWAARNGLLHMGTAESKLHRSGDVKNRIYYVYGRAACTKNDSGNCLVLKVEDLIEAYLIAAFCFLDELETDNAKLNKATEKISGVLIERGLQ